MSSRMSSGTSRRMAAREHGERHSGMNSGRRAGGSGADSCLLTIDQLAERLTVSIGCIRSWRLKGEGPPAIRVGTALRWDSAEVDAWLDGRRESRLESQ